MNILKIIFNDIKKFMLQKKFLFIILMLSLIITSYSFSTFISDRMQIANIINTVNNSTNKYFIGNEKGIHKEGIEDLENWLKENLNSNYTINLYSDILLRDDIDTIIFQQQQIPESQLPDGAVGGIRVEKVEGVVEKPYNIIIGTNNNESRQISFIGEKIDSIDLENVSNYIMIDYNNSSAKKNPFILNDTLVIRDEEYIVKAINGINLYSEIFEFCNPYKYDKNTLLNIEPFIIPITTFFKNIDTVYALDIIIPDNTSTEKKEDFNTFIKNKFSDDTIIFPTKTQKAQLTDISKYLIIFLILIVLALINIIALYIFWININWRKYMIYRICGANKKNVFKIILLEAIVIGITAIVIGNSLYYLQTIYFNNTLLNIKNIFIIQFIILFLITILVSIEVFKIAKTNPRYIERR